MPETLTDPVRDAILALEAPTHDQAAQYLDEARRVAAANLAEATRLMGVRLQAKGEKPKDLLDIAEFNYKLSGLAAKQGNAGPQGVSIAFNFGATKPSNTTIDVTPKPDALGEAPAGVLELIPVTMDLAAGE